MRDVLKLGIVLMLYTLAAGAMLAFVHQKTAPIIEANKEAATSGEVLAEVLPGMDGGFEKRGTDTDFPYWVGFADAGRTTPGGYVFITYGKGYSSTIETLVGVDTDMTITGAKVVFQQETPGLGDKVMQVLPGETTPWFTDQFVGKSSADNLAVTKDDGIIDAISGATISSRAVTNSIKAGLGNIEAVLSGGEVVVEAIPEDEPDPFVLPAESDLAEVLPGMDGGFDVTGEGTEFPVWTGYTDSGKSDVGGYVFVARGEGFASTVHTLIATDTDGEITGIKTLFQDETPGYGDQVLEVRNGEEEPWFTSQFIGMSADDTIALSADGGSIDALTGATITSNAVTGSVAEGLANLDKVLVGETFPAWEYETIDAAELAAEAEAEEAAAAPVSADDALSEVLPGMDGGFEEQTDGDVTYWIGYRDSGKSDIGGYVFTASGEGFASTIETMVAVDPDGGIVGAKVLSQDETPGYGDQILEVRDGEDQPWFTAQFFGKKPADTIALTENGGDIDALTGATITSEAVTTAIDARLKEVMSAITGETYTEAESDEPDDMMAMLMAGAEEEEEEAEDEPDDLMAQLMGGDDSEDESADESDSQLPSVMPSDEDLAAVMPDVYIGIEPHFDAPLPYWSGYSDSGRTSYGGYAFVASGDGFASTIETLVGVDADGIIVGVKVLSQDETPGYGDQILEVRDGESQPWFTTQFIGKTASSVALTGDGGEIDAITGATVTSDAVTSSIAEGLKQLMEQVQ